MFNAQNIMNIGGAIIVVALVTTVVSHPASSQVITSMGNSFAGSIRAALGK